MFFRTKKTPSGRVLQLTESYRNLEGKPRQRVVVSLGDASIEKKDRTVIAKLVEARLYGYRDLFERQLSRGIQQWVDRIVQRVDREGRWRPLDKEGVNQSSASVDEERSGRENVINGVLADKINHTHNRMLGPVLLGLHAWKKLGLDKLLGDLGFNEAQRKAAAISVINRLVEPVTENSLEEWMMTSALPELLGVRYRRGVKDRFYRVSDRLLENRIEIEQHLRHTQEKLFSLERTILLYDLTNTHFEGICDANPKARRGKNKQKRNDCPQVVLGMVFDEYGFELTHQVFEGNRADSKTLVEMIERLRDILDLDGGLRNLEKPLVIVDSGIATKGNIAYLRKQGFDYLVNDSRKRRLHYREEFLNGEGFEVIADRDKKSQVEVKLLRDQDEEESDQGDLPKEGEHKDWVLLCKSEGRRQKEQAIRSRAEERFLDDLKKLAARISDGRLKDIEKIHRAIGKLLGRHPRVQRFYAVKLKTIPKKQRENLVSHKLVWQCKGDRLEANDELLGCYVLRTSREDLPAQKLWHLYMTLTQAEAGFKELKGNLGLRPNHHQKESRVDAHIFIAVLAYHLLCFIMHTMRKGGDTRSWRTIKRVLRTHSYATLIIPTKPGKIHRIRKAGIPEEEQKAIYRVFGIKWNQLPETRSIIPQKGLAIL